MSDKKKYGKPSYMLCGGGTSTNCESWNASKGCLKKIIDVSKCVNNMRINGMTYNEISKETGLPLKEIKDIFKDTKYEFMYE